MERERFRQYTIVKHFKREYVTDKNSREYLYVIMGHAKDVNSGKVIVIFKPLYENKFFNGVDFLARPVEDFYDEVDHVKYPDIKQKYRFEETSYEELKSIETD